MCGYIDSSDRFKPTNEVKLTVEVSEFETLIMPLAKKRAQEATNREFLTRKSKGSNLLRKYKKR